MTNPFSTEALVPTWTVASEILKGDLPGHPFHGNQWTSGQLSATHDTVSTLRAQLHDLVKGREGGGTMARDLTAAAKVARELARTHETLAEVHRGASREALADKHAKAAETLKIAASELRKGDITGAYYAVESAIRLSRDATNTKSGYFSPSSGNYVRPSELTSRAEALLDNEEDAVAEHRDLADQHQLIADTATDPAEKAAHAYAADAHSEAAELQRSAKKGATDMDFASDLADEAYSGTMSAFEASLAAEDASKAAGRE